MNRFAVILLLFFCSGATALIYEVVWSKYLVLIFGSTVQAHSMVLGVFMGGLALGNRLFGQWADRMARPLVVYGAIEMAIGLYAFAFDRLYMAGDRVFIALGSGLLEQGGMLLLLKSGLSLGLLLVPTVLMGGTLPLMASWLQKEMTEPSRRSALFYSLNSLGAVMGAGLAGFFLVRTIGLISTLHVTGIANIVIGVVAIWLAGRAKSTAGEMPPQRKRSSAEPSPLPATVAGRQIGFACALVFVVGAMSMALEVLASRSLSLVFGGSLQAFATMLMAFILGIGLGSAVIASPRFSGRLREGTTCILLLMAAGWIGFFVLTLEFWALLYVKMRNSLGTEQTRFLYHQLLTAGISMVVLGVPAAFLGSILPLWIRLIGGASATLGRYVGRLLTWNTLGAVLGVLFAGFVMMPALGLRGSLLAVALVLAAGALALAWKMAQRRTLAGAGVVGALLVVVIFAGAESWQRVVTSGVFRWTDESIAWNSLKQSWSEYEVIFYRDSADATVAIEVPRDPQYARELILTINGKPDASSHRDLSTQYLLAHLPMMARPDARNVFVLGLGSGITGGAVLGYPVERLVIAENCGPVVEAAGFFEKWNRGVLTNEATRLYSEDARTVLKLSPQHYDVIISEPSNPWVAGIGSVFTKEFYQLAASRMSPGGVMAQWFHIYEMEIDVVFLVMRTFQSVFPNCEIWESQFGDVILLGSQQPWESGVAAFEAAFDREGPRADLQRIGLRTPEAVWARQLASQRTSFAVPGPGRIQTDKLPILEYAAARAFYQNAGAGRLFAFDERTLQSAFVSAEKRAALAGMPDHVLLPIFSSFSSDNPQLMDYVNWRSENPLRDGTHPVYNEHPFLEIIFRPPGTYPSSVSIPEDSTLNFARLARAETTLRAQPERWTEAVEVIETFLENFDPATETLGGPEWLPAYFAAVAAKAWYQAGNLERAGQFIARGLEIAPGDFQLNYLDRLFKSAP